MTNRTELGPRALSGVARWLAILAASAIAIAACGSDTASPSPGAATPAPGATSQASEPPPPPPPTSRVLTIAHDSGPATFDPINSTLYKTWTNWQLFYESLAEAQPDGSLEPMLAESWDFSADGTVITFKLRQGVKFHNGEEMTSNDVKFSFDRIATSRVPFVQNLGARIAETVVIDPYTVEMRLTAPDAGLIYDIANPFPLGFAILNSKAATAVDPATRVIGTGPYRLTSFAPDLEMRLDRFEDYWRPLPDGVADTINFRFMPEESNQAAALLAGEIDVMFPTVASLPLLEGSDVVEITEVAAAGTININMNSEDVEALKDVRVRRAISMGLDRGALVDEVLFGKGRPAGLIPAALAWAIPVEDLPNYDYNPELARQLLREAGYEQLTLRFNHIGDWSDYLDRHAEAMQRQLAAIGITLIIEPAERTTWVSKLVSRDYEMGDNFTPFWSNPINYIEPREGRQGPTPDALRDLFVQARAATSPEEFLAKLREAALLEADLIFPEMRTINVSEFLAWRSDRLENVEIPYNLSRRFLLDVTFKN